MEKFTTHPTCPKCTFSTDDDDEREFKYEYGLQAMLKSSGFKLEEREVLNVTCPRCKFTQFMEPADKEK